MSNRPIVIACVIGLVVVFFLAGLRYEAPILSTISPGICGPLTDSNGNPAGNAGLCPSISPMPMPRDGQWEWAPFWASR